MKLKNKLSEVPMNEANPIHTRLPTLLIISGFFFALVWVEICLLLPTGFSFRMHAEKLFFALFFLVGVCSLHRFFFWSMLILFILSIIPMCIPILIFGDWLGNNKVYVLDKNRHLEEVHHFGQHMEGLVLMEKHSIVFDQAVVEFDLGICNFENTAYIKNIQLEREILEIQFQRVAFEQKEITCTCSIDLIKYQAYNTVDSMTYKLRLEDKKLEFDVVLE